MNYMEIFESEKDLLTLDKFDSVVNRAEFIKDFLVHTMISTLFTLLTVTNLTRKMRTLLEHHFKRIELHEKIGGFKRPRR